MTEPVVDLRTQLMRDEGVRLRLYQDQFAHFTIGVGHNLDAHGISLKVAEQILEEDISRATADVLLKISCAVTMDEVRRAVLVNMAFNMGVGGLLGFKDFLALCAKDDWGAASLAMLDSKWARQVGERAHRLTDQLMSGEWK